MCSGAHSKYIRNHLHSKMDTNSNTLVIRNSYVLYLLTFLADIVLFCFVECVFQISIRWGSFCFISILFPLVFFIFWNCIYFIHIILPIAYIMYYIVWFLKPSAGEVQSFSKLTCLSLFSDRIYLLMDLKFEYQHNSKSKTCFYIGTMGCSVIILLIATLTIIIPKACINYEKNFTLDPQK